MMRTKLAITLSVLMLSLAAASAQEAAPAANRGWYVGAEGGVPFSFGSFASFGRDKTRAGYGAGLYGGYCFNQVLSAEISAKWGGADHTFRLRMLHRCGLLARVGWCALLCTRVRDARLELCGPHEQHGPAPEEVVVTPADALAEDSAVPVLQDSSASIQPEIPELHPAIADTAAVPASAAVTFPEVYFAFDSHAIPESEYPKLRGILDVLNSSPEMCVTLVGWCDKYGSTGINRYTSLKRAEAVKAWLVDGGIDAARISAVGKGSDPDADSNAKARRVEIEKQWHYRFFVIITSLIPGLCYAYSPSWH